jgi:hypothetical protein
MLPDPNAYPSSVLETLVGVAVTRHVAVYFVRPELRVCNGNSVMLRAAMPKTSIEENGNSGSREDQVSGAPKVLQRSCRDSIAKPETVNNRTQRHLRLGVSAFV